MRVKIESLYAVPASELVALALIKKMKARKEWLERQPVGQLTKAQVREWQELKALEAQVLN